jgi:hypothetical protein
VFYYIPNAEICFDFSRYLSAIEKEKPNHSAKRKRDEVDEKTKVIRLEFQKVNQNCFCKLIDQLKKISEQNNFTFKLR